MTAQLATVDDSILAGAEEAGNIRDGGICRSPSNKAPGWWHAIRLQIPFTPRQPYRAIVAVAAWIGLSCLIGIYFRHFESFDKTYGPLGAAIGLYVWFYLSWFAVLPGGEINFLLGEIRHARTRQSSKTAYAEINNLNSAA